MFMWAPRVIVLFKKNLVPSNQDRNDPFSLDQIGNEIIPSLKTETESSCFALVLQPKLPRPRLDCKILQPEHCSTFRLYLTNFVRS